MAEIIVPSGLEGVVVTETRISEIDGTQGILRYRNRALADLAETMLWEDLLPWLAELPSTSIPATETQPPILVDDPLRRLAIIMLTAAYDPKNPLAYVLRLPLLLGATFNPDQDPGSGSMAYRFLSMLNGHPAATSAASALNAYWVVVAEHSLNASTFAVRVAASTGADLPLSLTAGVATLSGPLHGGAPEGVLALLEEAAHCQDISSLLRAKLDRGERLMGFGHRVYRTEDPRAVALRQMFSRIASPDQVRLTSAVEDAALRLLADRKPDRVLATNVEFYAGALLAALKIPPEWCSATFAVGRLAGWTAHYREQQTTGRLIRPVARYRP